ncbi:MAG: hypothetical protein IH622_08075 [Ochrobactrum anthropi]|uniref:Uncharacterized protein n=1 Tax=Brucella anthropi TaxID=529 RepID=A0A8I0N2S0_BRUAN|nr:hypothetical protein [Brucella anthropi]MBE0560764.1 hypothetical protein [Brucella anthropi]
MPFRSAAYRGIFSQAELSLLQQAYNRSCELLGRSPSTDDDRDQLARVVIRTFEDSDLDPELAAQRASELARVFE